MPRPEITISTQRLGRPFITALDTKPLARIFRGDSSFSTRTSRTAWARPYEVVWLAADVLRSSVYPSTRMFTSAGIRAAIFASSLEVPGGTVSDNKDSGTVTTIPREVSRVGKMLFNCSRNCDRRSLSRDADLDCRGSCTASAITGRALPEDDPAHSCEKTPPRLIRAMGRSKPAFILFGLCKPWAVLFPMENQSLTAIEPAPGQ